MLYRRVRQALLALGLVMAGATAATENAADTAPAENAAFQGWLADFREQALAEGISEAVLDQALSGLQPVDRVLEYDRRQPEFVDTFLGYLDRRLTQRRVDNGLEMLERHKCELADIEQIYAVPARYLVAFWGLESNYGSYVGDFPVIASLATLAADSRRGEFFRGELLATLRLVDGGHATPQELVGSWAGAMGQVQFIPSTFMAYAVDGNGDGRKDIWNTVPDALHSAANYLARLGWRGDETWGREIILPAGFDLRLTGPGRKRSAAEWAALGVVQADGRPLPDSDGRGAIVLPQGHTGPAFLVLRNFDIILQWNRSLNYALSVGLLADRLAGLPPLRTGLAADNRRLSRDQVIEIQERLLILGHDLGNADGIIGSRTRAAIADYQEQAGLPPDGFASPDLLERLQAATANFALGGRGEVRGDSGAAPPTPPVAKADDAG